MSSSVGTEADTRLDGDANPLEFESLASRAVAMIHQLEDAIATIKQQAAKENVHKLR